MKIYLVSLSTNHFELENRVYKTFQHSLEYIYYNLKTWSVESIKDCDFFDREHIKKFFTKEYFDNFENVVSKSLNIEFFIKKVKSNKYQFVFNPLIQDYYFFVCELEILELLDK